MYCTTVATSKLRAKCIVWTKSLRKVVSSLFWSWLNLVACKLSWTVLSPARIQPLYGAGRTESSGTGDYIFILWVNCFLWSNLSERFSERAGLPCKMKCHLAFDGHRRFLWFEQIWWQKRDTLVLKIIRRFCSLGSQWHNAVLIAGNFRISNAIVTCW